MGHYVHINVCFACDENEGVAELAKKHLQSEELESEAIWFLESLAGRTGTNPGPKGGLSTWGIVGNYTHGDAFVKCLIPFWTDLLSEVDGGPNNFEHILVFEEQEQSEQAIAHEIGRDRRTGELFIKKHACPFAWRQM